MQDMRLLFGALISFKSGRREADNKKALSIDSNSSRI